MKKFGLIGHPIAHSLSPTLFKAAYGGRYSYDLIEEEDFHKALEKFKDEYDAINVTAPFKELANKAAEIKSPECEVIGAANILIKGEEGIMAANSDVMGVVGAISNATKDGYRTAPVALIVGCGGAAKAAAYAVCCSGYQTIIVNRDIEKAQAFADRLSTSLSTRVGFASLDMFGYWFQRAGIIIYTLPVAIPAISDLKSKEIKGGMLWTKKNKIIIEANYKEPAFSGAILKKLQSINPKIKYVDGKEWLLHQAVGAYRSFTMENPNVEEMKMSLVM